LKIDYPLKFYPILKERLWGGFKLNSLLHKEKSEQPIGESWEISAVDGSVSVVANGHLKQFEFK
jgi:mannose-6-phosphate isomerase